MYFDMELMIGVLAAVFLVFFIIFETVQFVSWWNDQLNERDPDEFAVKKADNKQGDGN